MHTTLARAGFHALAITTAHAADVAARPAVHRYPFDRLLVAQALAGDLTLATADPAARSYTAACRLI